MLSRSFVGMKKTVEEDKQDMSPHPSIARVRTAGYTVTKGYCLEVALKQYKNKLADSYQEYFRMCRRLQK